MLLRVAIRCIRLVVDAVADVLRVQVVQRPEAQDEAARGALCYGYGSLRCGQDHHEDHCRDESEHRTSLTTAGNAPDRIARHTRRSRNMSEPLKLGCLGAGMIATVNYGYLPGLRHIPDKAVLTAISDPVIDRARDVAAEYGVEQHHVYADVDAMLAGADIDIL